MALAITWRQVCAALTLFPLLVCAQPEPSPDDELAAALERVYLEADYQRVLPEEVERDSFRLPDWLARLLGSMAGLSFLGMALMWTSLGVMALMLVYFLSNADFSRLGKRMRKRLQPGDRDEDTPSTPATLADWLEKADSLARKGNHAAAIHVLLLGVLGWMRTSRVQDWPPAATAREILAGHAGAREPLEFLVRNAELAHFGGWGGSEADYRACRARAMELTAEGNIAR